MMKNRSAEAYLTVEASLVFPMVLAIIAAFFMLSFFMYDRGLLEQDSYILCFRESIRKQEGDRAQRLLADASQLGDGGVILSDLQYKAVSSGGSIRLIGSAAAASWRTAFSEEAAVYDPPKGIRTWCRIRDLAEEVTNLLKGQEMSYGD